MPTRSERRRRVRHGNERETVVTSILRRGDIVTALVLAAAAVIVVGGAVVIFGGGDDGAAPQASSTPAALFSPTTPDEIAVADLSRQAILALPQGKWPELYDSFNAEFQARCPRDQFEQTGQTDAQAQGANLSRIGFKGLQEASVEGDSARAVIVGEVAGQSEYTIQAYFTKAEGTWKLAPGPGTQGCDAFSRLSG